jgi:hypothetical protein
MRIEVRTCNKVRIMLEQNKVKSQRKIINGKNHHFQITLDGGKILDLESPVEGIELDPDIDITKRAKYLNRLTLKIDGKGVEDGKSI